MQVVYKNCDYRRISGSSLLICGRLCRQTTRDTQTPIYHAAVDLAFVTDDDAKMLKNTIDLMLAVIDLLFYIHT